MKYFLLALLLLVVHMGRAAVITVSNTNDSGAGSLRQAVTSAQNGDIINISLAGTITLASELPMITNIITINGNSSGTTISGNNVCRVFTVDISTGTVTLNNLNVINGFTTSGNSSGMSAITNNNGKVVVNNASFSHCITTGSQAYGGAIAVSTDLDLNNCTIYNCTSDLGGGALASLDVTTINILNCTIVNNHSNDPIGGGGMNLLNATVSIKNTILASNTSGPTNILANSVLKTSTLTSLGYNLSDDNGGFAGVAGDLMSKNFVSDIKLDALANNGGPVQTCAFQSGSLAIDGAPSAISTDARGYGRYHNPDIGAYEYHGIPPSLITPVTQASGITFTGVTTTTIPVSWTRGSGAAVAVFVHEGTASNAAPVDYETYTANAVFMSGTQIGISGWYCVYNSTGTSLPINGLSAGTDYTTQVCEYNGDASYEKYNIATATNNPNSQTTLVAPTITGISPTSGSIAGGTSVTITGANLTGATAVIFGSMPVTGFTVNSATQITATSPYGSAGAVDVTVTTAGGTSLTGAGDKFTYADAPGAPTIGTATAGNTQASVAFSSPASNGGSAITGYTVTSSPEGLTATGSSSPIAITGLTNGTAYTFTVTATNSIGTGSPSFASNSATPATTPGAPAIGITTAGDTQASVAFTAPASNGGATITGYTVTSSPGNFTATGSSSPITVTGLTNGTPYTFTVTATNSAGTGSESVASISVTPKAPQTITFNNPGAQNFGTTPVLSATASSGLTPTFTSSTSGVCMITSGGTLAFVTTGTCTINADQPGNSSFLAATTVFRSFSVSAVVPGAPTIGAATAGNTQASVSFTAPSSNGGATIISYTVTSSPGGFTATGSSSPITVTGLTNGTAYTFTVFATNSAGLGSESVASNSVTPNTTPTTQASSLVFSSVGLAQMTIGWTNGNGANRAVFVKEGTGTITNPVDNATYAASTDWSSKGTQLGSSGYYCVYNNTSNSVTITGLNIGTTYTVQVFEYNGSAGAEKYYTSPATDNPKSQATQNSISSIVLSGSSPTNASSVSWTVTFDALLTGLLNTSNFSLSGTGLIGYSVSGITGSGTTYTVTANTGSGSGTLGLNLDNAAGLSQGISNTLPYSGQTYTIDKTAPTVTITSSATDPTNASIPVTITFSESVTGFVDGDISVTNGTAGSFTSVNAYTYTASITPTTAGTVTVNVAGSVATDEAGNNNTAATALIRVYDNIAPTVSSVGVPTNATYVSGQNLDFTVNFSEAVGVVTTGGSPYLTLTIGSTSVHAAYLSGSETTALTFRYTVATGDLDTDGVAIGTSITLNGGTLKDATGNDATLTLNSIASTANVKVDAVAPAVTITSTASASTNTSPIPVMITFSESVTGFDASDITVANGTKGTLNGSGLSYSINVTPSGQGAVTVNIAVGVTTDAAGNGNTAATQLSRTYDNQGPTTTLSSTTTNTTNASPIPVIITFSESVTGFDAGDIIVTNGTKGTLSGSGASYSINITPTGQGAVTVNVAAGVAIDVAGNANTAATQLSRTYDGIAPSVSVSSVIPDPTNVSPVPLSIVFSEAVTGFTLSDITVGNGTASNLQTSNNITWTADITPAQMGAFSVDIHTGVAKDLAGNGNTASVYFQRTYDPVAPTISSVGIPSNGTYIVGQNLDFTVNFSEAVLVATGGGTPYLILTIGSTPVHAVYLSGSYYSALTFRYTVTSGDLDSDGITIGTSITLNGGTITDYARNNASLTLTSVGSTTGVLVDGVVPTVSSVTSPYNATYTAGQNLDFTVNLSKAVTVVTSGGTPWLTLTIGSIAVHVAYLSGSGTAALTFRYTVASGDLDSNGIAVGASITPNGGTLKDAVGNNATLTLNSVGSTAGVLVDAVAPTISSFTYPLNGNYLTSQDINFLVNFSEPVTVVTSGGTSYLTLTIGISSVHAGYVSGSGTSIQLFRYTVATGNADIDGIDVSANITANGSTIKDAAGNDASLDCTAYSLSGVLVNIVKPTVMTQAVSAISTTIATGNGNITDLGVPNPTAYGVCWNTGGTPTTTDSKVDKGSASSTGAFTASMTGLTANTVYHVRSFATNTAGTSYGTEVTFTTNGITPAVTTQAVTGISITTATGNGNITDLGIPNPTAYGVCWNTGGTPTTMDSKVDKGSVSSTGTFTASMTSLTANTVYHIRSFATNTAGTSYGADVTFTTSGITPAVTTQSVTDISTTTATGYGNITNLGVPNPTAYGVCWNTVGTPTTLDSKVDKGAATLEGAFTASMTSLSTNTTYYVRAYATNIAGTVYGTEVSFTTGKIQLTIADPTITPKEYDGTTDASPVTTLGNVLGKVSGDDVTVFLATSVFDTNNAGQGKTVTVTYSLGGADAGKYLVPITSILTSGKVTAKPVTVTATSGQTKVYGSVDPTFTYTVVPALVGSDALSGTLDRAGGETVDAFYAIGIGTLANANYNISFVSKDFSITAKPIMVTANAGQTKVYGDVDPTLTYTVAPALVGSDAFTGTLTRAVGETVGTSYAIGIGSLANADYNISFVSKDFSITAKPITVTATAGQTKVYGDVDPFFTYTVAPALVGSDAFTGMLDRVAGETVGSPYAIGIGTLANSNYNISFAGKDFSITAKPITVTVNAGQTKVYGDVDPTFTYTVAPALVGSDVLSGTLDRADGETVGAFYAIGIGTLANANYNISFVSKDFSITAKALSISNPALTASKTYNGSTIANVSAGTLSGIISGDANNVSVSAVANYDNRNVGSGKTINVVYSLAGSASSNYTKPIDYAASNGVIAAKQLSINNTVITDDKMYDGNTDAAVESVGTLLGIETVDDNNVSVTAIANYNDAKVGTSKIITVVYALSGGAAGNYIVPANLLINTAKISETILLKTLLSPTAGCEGSSMELSYFVLSGTPFQYQITFGAAALSAGFQNISYTNLVSSGSNGVVSISVPSGIPFGTYQASLQVRNELGLVSDLYSFQFVVNVSADYIINKFDDVVLCDNKANIFSSYQWYKNGIAINGATNQYYSDPEGLVGTYSLNLKTVSGQELQTCSKVLNIPLVKKVSITVYPNPMKSNQMSTVKITGMSDEELQGAVMNVYNMQGVKIYSTKTVQQFNSLTLQNLNGSYVGHIITAKGNDYVYRILLVK